MTNLTEFLGRDRLAALPLLCGIPAGHSDYERFRAFCQSAGQAFCRQSADVAWVRAVLRACFACDLPPDCANCDAIWQLTAESLFDAGNVPELPPVSLPTDCPELPHATGNAVACPPLAGAESWAEWCTAAMHQLKGCSGVRVSLPHDFRPQKTSLWHAERILRGEETDRDVALTQQVDFLAGFCSAERRLWLVTDCDNREVLQLLTQVARRKGSLPPLVWIPAHAPSRQMLFEAAALVRTPDGVPPIVTG